MGRILVVDDDRSTVTAMTKLLRQDGHEVAPFISGREAVAALRRGTRFDAVITDLEMRSADGAAVARAAREYCPNACIVATHRGRVSPITCGVACMVLEKPIQYDAVHEVIAACLANRGHGGSLCARGRVSGSGA